MRVSAHKILSLVSAFVIASCVITSLLQRRSHERCVTDGPIITLFTTFNSNATPSAIHQEVIRRWGLLQPRVRLVLFISSEADVSGLPDNLLAGWTVRDTLRMSIGGMPVLRRMFKDVMQDEMLHAPLYGYANADIVFTENFTESLLVILDYCLHKMLLVGRRKNYVIPPNWNPSEDKWVNESFYMHDYDAYAEDYFITTKDSFNWDAIPDFVVGRAGFDNWLVATAIKAEVPVIDASGAITAIHLSKEGYEVKGHLKRKGDIFSNYRLAGQHFRYVLGATICAHLTLSQKGTGLVELEYRTMNRCRLYFFQIKKNPYIFVKTRLLESKGNVK